MSLENPTSKTVVLFMLNYQFNRQNKAKDFVLSHRKKIKHLDTNVQSGPWENILALWQYFKIILFQITN